jgi:hypothetical protein
MEVFAPAPPVKATLPAPPPLGHRVFKAPCDCPGSAGRPPYALCIEPMLSPQLVQGGRGPARFHCGNSNTGFIAAPEAASAAARLMSAKS